MKVSPKLATKCLELASHKRTRDVVSVPIPPSINNLFATSGRRRVVSKEYKAWRFLAVHAFQSLLKPDSLPVKILVRVCGKVRSNRDLDNFLKPIGDALVTGGVIPDDSIKTVVRWEIWYVAFDEKPTVEVRVQPWKPSKWR